MQFLPCNSRYDWQLFDSITGCCRCSGTYAAIAMGIPVLTPSTVSIKSASSVGHGIAGCYYPCNDLTCGQLFVVDFGSDQKMCARVLVNLEKGIQP